MTKDKKDRLSTGLFKILKAPKAPARPNPPPQETAGPANEPPNGVSIDDKPTTVKPPPPSPKPRQQNEEREPEEVRLNNGERITMMAAQYKEAIEWVDEHETRITGHDARIEELEERLSALLDNLTPGKITEVTQELDISDVEFTPVRDPDGGGVFNPNKIQGSPEVQNTTKSVSSDFAKFVFAVMEAYSKEADERYVTLVQMKGVARQIYRELHGRLGKMIFGFYNLLKKGKKEIERGADVPQLTEGVSDERQ